MNKQLDNHKVMRAKFKAILQSHGITTDQDSTNYYVEVPIYKKKYHFELYLNSLIPIKVKLAYAEDSTNNQCQRYLADINRLLRYPEALLFVHGGRGFKCSRNLSYLSEIKELNRLGFVVELTQVFDWLKTKLNEKESR